MSLIIKGIDLPKEGEWLSVIIKPTKEVVVDTIRYGDFALLKTEYGLAIQIPKGHGRLIDASTETTVESVSGTAMDVGTLLIALKQYVPTIFEAEE